jgi:hypothetical protein
LWEKPLKTSVVVFIFSPKFSTKCSDILKNEEKALQIGIILKNNRTQDPEKLLHLLLHIFCSP